MPATHRPAVRPFITFAAACSAAAGTAKPERTVCVYPSRCGGTGLRARILQECRDTPLGAATRQRPSSAGSPTGRTRPGTSTPTLGRVRSASGPAQQGGPRRPARPAPSPSSSHAPGRRDPGRLAAGPPNNGVGLRPGAGAARRSPLWSGPRGAKSRDRRGGGRRRRIVLEMAVIMALRSGDGGP